MSQTVSRHFTKDQIQAQLNFHRVCNPPVKLQVPVFHNSTWDVRVDDPFGDFHPFDQAFKDEQARIASGFEPELGDFETDEQALVNLWQACDTLDEFVQALRHNVDLEDDDLVNLAHAFESSIEEGLEAATFLY